MAAAAPRANRRVRDWMCGVMLMDTSVERPVAPVTCPSNDRVVNLSYGYLNAWRQQSSRDRSPQSVADRQKVVESKSVAATPFWQVPLLRTPARPAQTDDLVGIRMIFSGIGAAAGGQAASQRSHRSQGRTAWRFSSLYS